MSPAQAAAAALRIQDRYGTISSPVCDAHFKTVLSRLLSSDAGSLRVVVLDTNEPLALSPGDRTIMVSRGLLALFSNEAELSFMIAHEAGHYVLRHHAADVLGSEDSSARRELESEADAFAVSAMSRAGYDSSFAVSALTAVYNRVKNRDVSAAYPSLHERIMNVATIALQRGALGNGIADRRAYHECRSSLRL